MGSTPLILSMPKKIILSILLFLNTLGHFQFALNNVCTFVHASDSCFRVIERTFDSTGGKLTTSLLLKIVQNLISRKL